MNVKQYMSFRHAWAMAQLDKAINCEDWQEVTHYCAILDATNERVYYCLACGLAVGAFYALVDTNDLILNTCSTYHLGHNGEQMYSIYNTTFLAEGNFLKNFFNLELAS